MFAESLHVGRKGLFKLNNAWDKSGVMWKYDKGTPVCSLKKIVQLHSLRSRHSDAIVGHRMREQCVL